MPPPNQSIRQGAQNSLWFSVVNMWISPIEVAERLHQPVTLLFEYKPVVRSAPSRTHRQAKLEGHVEPRRRRRAAVEADAGEVARGSMPKALRPTMKASEIQALVPPIVGNVEERFVARFSARAWPRSSSSLWRRGAF